ncbi:hypothetical protein GCM10017788_16690 [Amycolatopsis acidiphila]|nr:hypothetical protein GCM10017788_16690 [Amycolatopsis acidiphila]
MRLPDQHDDQQCRVTADEQFGQMTVRVEPGVEQDDVRMHLFGELQGGVRIPRVPGPVQAGSALDDRGESFAAERNWVDGRDAEAAGRWRALWRPAGFVTARHQNNSVSHGQRLGAPGPDGPPPRRSFRALPAPQSDPPCWDRPGLTPRPLWE